MQIEDVAYANSQNKDQYLNFFQEIFIHARNKSKLILIYQDLSSISLFQCNESISPTISNQS